MDGKCRRYGIRQGGRARSAIFRFLTRFTPWIPLPLMMIDREGEVEARGQASSWSSASSKCLLFDILLVKLQQTATTTIMPSTSQETPPEEEATTPDDMSSLAPIHRLPPELVDSLLLYVPADQLQYTSLNLKQVFPQLAISERHLFTHLRVGRPEQLRPMWERLRREKYGEDEQQDHTEEDDEDDERGLLRFVESFTLACFSGDADLMNNVLRLIPTIRRLSLNLGTNFAPEHLAEAFQVERKRIEVVEVRFRPYVDRATYYQFLKVSTRWQVLANDCVD